MASQQELNILVKLTDEASGKLDGIAAKTKDMGKVFTAVGAAITGSLGLTVYAAAEAEAKIASFDATLKSAGGVTADVRNKLLDASKAFTQLGFDDETAAQSLALMYQRTKDVSESMKLTAAAADLARAKHVDLDSATKMVALALSGNGRALKQYGIELEDGASATEVFGAITSAVGGQAVAFSKTFEGQLEVLRQTTGNLGEEIGGALLPILTDLLKHLTPLIDKVSEWIRAHPELTKWIVIIVGAIGLLLTVLGPLLLALPAISMAMGVFGTVMAAVTGPIGLVILAIGALVAALIWLYNNVDKVRAFFSNQWNILKDNVIAANNAIKEGIMAVWNSIAAYFSAVWENIKAIFQAAYDWIMNTIVRPIANAVQGVYDSVKNIASTVGGNLKAAGQIIGQNISAGAAAVGKFLGFAEGGVVPGPQGAPMLAVVHGGETVIPPGRAGAAGGVNVYITGNTISSQMDLNNIASEISKEIVRTLRLNGKFSV